MWRRGETLGPEGRMRGQMQAKSDDARQFGVLHFWEMFLYETVRAAESQSRMIFIVSLNILKENNFLMVNKGLFK